MNAKDWNASEAILAFTAHLTCRDEPTVLGTHHDAAPVVERVREFCKKHELPEPRDGWLHGITFNPSPKHKKFCRRHQTSGREPMSKKLVEEVSSEHPDLLPTNLGRTCYQHTVFLIEKLRANGHDAHLMCKSPGEGQYRPPGFETRFVVGLDGKPYACSGVSHDAIWCDDKQFDTLGSANEHDRPIYRRQGDPGWSFNKDDGPQITASPTWNEIPREWWRNNNPPFPKDGAQPQPNPTPQPPTSIVFPSYGELGDDAFFRNAVGVPLQEDMTHAGEALNDGSSVWFSRTTYLVLVAVMKHKMGIGPVPNTGDIVRGVRNEWRAVLKKNHPEVIFSPF